MPTANPAGCAGAAEGLGLVSPTAQAWKPGNSKADSFINNQRLLGKPGVHRGPWTEGCS